MKGKKRISKIIDIKIEKQKNLKNLTKNIQRSQ